MRACLPCLPCSRGRAKPTTLSQSETECGIQDIFVRECLRPELDTLETAMRNTSLKRRVMFKFPSLNDIVPEPSRTHFNDFGELSYIVGRKLAHYSHSRHSIESLKEELKNKSPIQHSDHNRTKFALTKKKIKSEKATNDVILDDMNQGVMIVGENTEFVMWNGTLWCSEATLETVDCSSLPSIRINQVMPTHLQYNYGVVQKSTTLVLISQARRYFNMESELEYSCRSSSSMDACHTRSLTAIEHLYKYLVPSFQNYSDSRNEIKSLKRDQSRLVPVGEFQNLNSTQMVVPKKIVQSSMTREESNSQLGGSRHKSTQTQTFAKFSHELEMQNSAFDIMQNCKGCQVIESDFHETNDGQTYYDAIENLEWFGLTPEDKRPWICDWSHSSDEEYLELSDNVSDEKPGAMNACHLM